MMTVDKLLLELLDNASPQVESYMSNKDARLVRSLSTAANSPQFLTENQSKLLVKVLLNYKEEISKTVEHVAILLEMPIWSKPFRVVEQVRKVYVRNMGDQTSIVIEYSFSAAIRKILTSVSKHIQGGVQTISNKVAWIELTEKNIITILDALRPLKFDVEDILLEHYNTIKSWKVEDECKQLFYGADLLPTIRNKLDTEFTVTSDTIALDRSLRYQYIVKKTGTVEENLTNLLTYRTNSKVWINSDTHTLTQVIGTLKELNRLPALVVFDSWQPATCSNHLIELRTALLNNGIDSGVGIYFRLPSEEQGKAFNTLISEHKYNAKLDTTTQIAGVQTGKLPKFFLKDCDWEPKSVIVLGNNLRHSKTAVYSNRCDLIVSYSDKPSIFESQTGWATSTWAL